MQLYPLNRKQYCSHAVRPSVNVSVRAIRHTTLTQQAVDVIVLGNSTLADAVAAGLARRDKKVIHLRDLGLQAPSPTPEALKPCVLPDVNVHLMRLADESASFLRGLELQMNTPLVQRCQSLDVGPPMAAAGAEASRASSSAGGEASSLYQAAVAMERLAEACKDMDLKAKLLHEEDLLSPFPMLRPSGLVGLLQPEGAVVNARTTQEALTSLAIRRGALVKDGLILRGWQDMGSAFRVHASSEIQPDLISVFEAEQLVLAPGTWATDELALFGLRLNVQMRERLSMRCPSTGDLSRLPLLRFWGGAPNSAEEREEHARAVREQEQQRVQQEQRGERLGAVGTGSGGGGGSSGGASSGVGMGVGGTGRVAEGGGAGVVPLGAAGNNPSSSIGAHWLLYPPSAGRQQVKLSASPQAPGSSRTVQTCWEWQPPETPSSTLEPGLSLPLSRQRRQASRLVRGLGADDCDLRVAAETSPQGAQSVLKPLAAIDLLTPDGLPILGWHPGFEPGRVLVTCTASGSFSAPQQHEQAPSSSLHSSAASAELSGLPRRDAAMRMGTHGAGQLSNASKPNDKATNASSRSSSRRDGESSDKALGWGSSGTDGYQLSLAVASAACNAVTGVSTEGGGLPKDSAMDLRRPCLQAQGVAETLQGDMLQGGLRVLQDGSAWRQQRVESMTEEELQAEEERQVIARRIKAGGLGHLRAAAQQQQGGPKQFF